MSNNILSSLGNITNSQATPGMTTWDSIGQGAGRGDNNQNTPALPVIKSIESLASNNSTSDKLQHTCADIAWVTVAQCQKEPDKHFAKRIYCGKEWCPVCGVKRSRHHNRKIARVLPKAMQIESMGYFVIELPDAYRKQVEVAYSKKALQELTNKVVEVFAGKRQGRKGRQGGLFSRGLIRWHWFGDKYADNDTNKWNPHLNILVDSAYIDKERLEDIKAALRSALDIPELIVHYSYCDTPGQMFQRVEYITRATFRRYNWNSYMAHQLYGFRNQRWWGSWKDDPAWHIDPTQEREYLAADELERHICPDCGGKLVWSLPIHAAYLETMQAVEIGETGFYRIPIKEYSGTGELTDDQKMLLNLKRLDRIAVYKVNRLMFEKQRALTADEAWGHILTAIDDEYKDYTDKYSCDWIQGEIYLN